MLHPRNILLVALALTLNACPDPAPAGVTVTGKVLDGFGLPGAFMPVLVGNKVTSSDASGNFSATGVVSPYQLVVLQAAQKYAQVYQGVTRTDPIVVVFQAATNIKKATVKVNFSGVGTGTGLMDMSNPVNANGGVSGSVATPGTSYSTDLQWTGPSSFETSICAILTSSTNNVATAINAYGEQERVFVQDAQTATATITMAPVATKTISGTVTVPAGFVVNAKTLAFVCGSKAQRPSYPFTFDTGNASSFSYVAPVLTNLLQMSASAKKGDASLYTQQFGLAPDASGVSLVLPAPIELALPENNALGINPVTTKFSWSLSSLGVNQVSFTPTVQGPLGLTIYTSSASVNLPDLSALGYAFPKGVNYKWSANADSNVPSVNDALNGVPLSYLKNYSTSSSGERQFTTAP
jgi:hypothetical protein